ncbi:hypothetical protein BS50DRAFT_591218 [Corynespora cassiicola Philippines]|uniref:Uncharacterized protein n=1 Tax=Corynespora cassiicola Philippines TaxID=1448308 RepID=A0A2T2NC47_CORCC|nr:hypothetical protein BS50DRAFT_591218 [Corynespora cassiicola Philippines]
MTLEVETRFIKHGQWTDLDRGPVMGKTITTSTSTGNLVIAILAVLSTLGTAHLWHLVTFAIHQVRANGRPSDALFRQQQAMLRTLPTPSSVMADTIKLWWAWRHKAKRPFLRSLVLLLLALSFTATTIAASVFSSLIVSTKDLIVLVDSPKCGSVDTSRFFTAFYADRVEAVASPYAEECYRDGTLPETCKAFVRPNIPFTITEAPCPFDPIICKNGSVSLDSGLLDVGPTFGLNIKPSEGVKFRKKTTCAVLPLVREHVDVLNYTEYMESNVSFSREPIEGESVISFSYGPTPDSPNTYGVGVIESALLQFYTVNTMKNYSNPEAPTFRQFDPIDLLKPNNSNLVLIFLGSNAVTYNQTIEDPLFSAHVPVPIRTIDLYGQFAESTLYMADLMTRVMACQEQYEYCYIRPSGEEFCTGLRDIPYTSQFPDLTELQRRIVALLAYSSYMFDMSRAKDTLAGKSLRNDKVVSSLPDNQWILELERWNKQTWAAFQIAVTDHAIGPTLRDTGTDAYDPPKSEGGKQLCRVQKMGKTGGVANISVFGLAFIITFSCLIVLLDFFVLKFLIYLSQFRRALAPRIDRWIQDGIWQLQRRAYEGEGHRCWTDLEMEIPLTTEGKELKDLPITWVPEKSPFCDSASTIGRRNDSAGYEGSFTQESVMSRGDPGPVNSRQNGLGLSNMI